MEILRNPNYDFLGKVKICVTASLVLIAVGAVAIKTKGVRYGVEFSGGTQLIAKFQQRPQVDQVRRAVDKVTAGAVIQTYDDPSKNQVLVRLRQRGDGGDTELAGEAQAVLKQLASEYSSNPVVESSTEIVGPIVGAELRRKAVQLDLVRPPLPAHLHRVPVQRRGLGQRRPPSPSCTTSSSRWGSWSSSATRSPSTSSPPCSPSSATA